MAKRRRVEAPDEAFLAELEAEIAKDGGAATESRQRASPIAQVAAEAAATSSVEATDRRATRARDEADATRYRDAEAAGRVMADVPLDAIDADAMVRDRMVLDQGEMDELRRSILDHGLRLPIEVYAREGGDYGLISGYRRLRAVRSIHGELGLKGWDTIRAVVRDPDEIGGAIVAMVEENEIRAQLSHYERGRIAVIAAQDGAFVNTEAAVAALFASASKGKRSKIRILRDDPRGARRPFGTCRPDDGAGRSAAGRCAATGGRSPAPGRFGRRSGGNVRERMGDDRAGSAASRARVEPGWRGREGGPAVTGKWTAVAGSSGRGGCRGGDPVERNPAPAPQAR